MEQQVRCILYTVGVNKADTFCMFYFTVGILVKIAATFIDLKKGFELINLFFLYHTIFFSACMAIRRFQFVTYESYQ